MLLRLFRNLTSRGRPVPEPTAARRGTSPPGAGRIDREADFDERCRVLEIEQRKLCEAGLREDALALVITQLPRPGSAEQAQTLMRRIVTPILEDWAAKGDASVACRIEHAVYGRLVKVFESPEHHTACLSMIDEPMYRLGKLDAPGIAPLGAKPAARLLFFFHNLGSDFAHTLLFCDLVEAYLAAHPDDAHTIGIAGICGAAASPSITALQVRWQIEIHHLAESDGLRGPFGQVARMIASGVYDRAIVVSVPIAISYLTGLLPPSRIGWLTMKYQLSCFEHLRHRCSFRSGLRREVLIDGRNWLQAAPLFGTCAPLKPALALPPVIQRARQSAIVLYTINREEKIRHPQFLERVARILERVGNSVFVWTGRECLPEIDDFFAARGLQDRHLFAGWVTPDDLLQAGDLFLDTPILSGNVAAQATALGLPVLTDADAITWVGTFMPAYLAERGTSAVAHLDALIEPLQAQGIRLQCAGDDDYVEQAVRLALDPQLRRQFSAALAAFAAHYFFDSARAASDHFVNLRAPVAG